MVNINIEIPDELHKELKLVSVLDDVTLKSYVTAVLDEAASDALKKTPGLGVGR